MEVSGWWCSSISGGEQPRWAMASSLQVLATEMTVISGQRLQWRWPLVLVPSPGQAWQEQYFQLGRRGRQRPRRLPEGPKSPARSAHSPAQELGSALHRVSYVVECGEGRLGDLGSLEDVAADDVVECGE